jgi:glycosyl transferase family 25
MINDKSSFPPVLVINLDRDVDRMTHMHLQLAACGLEFERFPAVRGDAIPTDLNAAYFLGRNDKEPVQLTKGELGCYASHLQIMKSFSQQTSQQLMLVLEDDVELPTSFSRLLIEIIAKLPTDWDIVRLSNTVKHAYAPMASLSNGSVISRCSVVPGSTGAYLISRTGALKFSRDEKRFLPVDQDLRRVWHWNLNTFVLTPPIVRADVFPISTIDQLSPAQSRSALNRLKQLRKFRHAEQFRRFKWNVQHFGWAGAAACFLLNIFVRLAPKPSRFPLLKFVSSLIRSR